MAEPIGVASGLLALATFAFQSSVILCNTVQSFQSHPKRVRDLIEELEALKGVLGPLTERISATNDTSLSALDLPLRRCGDSCKDFEQQIMKCLSRSGGSRTSFRDWAKLRYMGDDIDGFRRLLAGYKLTISIALTDANLRKSSATAESLESYKDLIGTATADLEAHLENINEKLDDIYQQTATGPEPDAAERRLIKEEQLSTRKCLQICAQLSAHIDQIQLTSIPSGDPLEADHSDAFPENVTKVGLQDCKNDLLRTKKKLEGHMQDLMARMVTKLEKSKASKDDLADLVMLQDEWKTTNQCMEICSTAETHLKDSYSTIDNYGTGDAVQFLVSTNEKTIHGRNRGLGWRTRQFGGHCNDVSLQQVSRDMTSVNVRDIENKDSPSGANKPFVSNGMEENESTSAFGERYGRGFKLTPESDPKADASSTRPADKGK